MNFYKKIDNVFEKMANFASHLIGNSMVFIVAVGLVIFWFCVHDWGSVSMTETIYHVIISITFLSFFIIQRTFTHFTKALHLKINELVVSNEKAHNNVVNAEEKSSDEMKEMSKVHDAVIAEDK